LSVLPHSLTEPLACLQASATCGENTFQFEHRCFVKTSLDDTVLYTIIGVVSGIAVIILALIIKNIVDRKKYQAEV